MEDILEKLDSTIITPTNDENVMKTNFDGLYKNWGKLGHQEQRRKDILQTQKGNRNNNLDTYRGILELVNAEQENEIYHDYKSVYRPSIYVAGFTRTSLSYKNVLMMSEWMIEKPEDFSENWYMVPCPKGVRVLVVANQGTTKGYTKFGNFRFECRTALPGGNPCGGVKNRCCILDGFYVEKTQTVYVLDLLAWNHQPMTDGETEFRHFWLQGQLAEIPSLQVINKKNKLLFKILPKVPCDTVSINEFMMKYPPFEDDTLPMDGLLFYHKRAHYFAGETPLVGWLFPYMLPEVISADVTIHPKYMAMKPVGYKNQADFIQKFQEKYEKKQDKWSGKRRSRQSSVMETADTEQVETNDITTQENKMEAETELKESSKEVTEQIMEADPQPGNLKPKKNEDLHKSLDNETME